MAEVNKQKWSIDKHIPLALVATIAGAIIIQTVTAVWWIGTFAATTNERLAQVEKRLAQTELFPERLASLETEVKMQTEVLKGIREDLRTDRGRVQSRNAAEDRDKNSTFWRR